MRNQRQEETDLGAMLESINKRMIDDIHKVSIQRSVTNLKRLDDFYSGSLPNDRFIK